MFAVQRIYMYVVAGIGLAMFLVGLAYGGGAALELVVAGGGVEATFRNTIATASAGVVIGLPVWALHWRAAQRLAQSATGERASALRRLYFYLVNAFLLAAVGMLGNTLIHSSLGATTSLDARVDGVAALRAGWHLLLVLVFWVYHLRLDGQERLAVGEFGSAATLRRLYLYGAAGLLMLGLAAAGTGLIQHLLTTLAEGLTRIDPAGILQSAWALLVVSVFWAYHLYIARLNRASVGEFGASATIRRWYAYGIQVIFLVALLAAASELIRSVGYGVVAGNLLVRDVGPGTMATALVAAAIWFFHRRWTSHGEIADQDLRTTVRAVAGFAIVALTVAITLASGVAAISELLARPLGANRSGELPDALVGPLGAVLVYGTGWGLVRRWLARDAADAEAARQAGVRRLYTHLVALASLVAAASGLAGLLVTLVDQLFEGSTLVLPDSWADQVSLFLALTGVGVPVWLAHWRPTTPPEERQALSRRIYLVGALLLSVLSLIGAGAGLAFTIVNWTLSEAGTSPLVEIGRALSVGLVAAIVATYHSRVLRGDVAARAQPVDAATDLIARGPAASFRVEISGVTQQDIAQALAALPPGAAYSVHRIEPASGATVP